MEPIDLTTQIASHSRKNTSKLEPHQLLDLRTEKDKQAFLALLESGVVEVIDEYLDQYKELLEITYPTPNSRNILNQEMLSIENDLQRITMGTWVYYPWRKSLVHVLSKKDFHVVQYSRNRLLIASDEQAKCTQLHIAIVGLSVGSSITQILTLEGIAHAFTLVDGDTLSLSNLNRILGGVSDIGKPKTQILAQRILEINPYLEIRTSTQLTKTNAEEILSHAHIILDEIDNLAMKYTIREIAKVHRIPVLMATDNGEECIIDIERYDLDDVKAPFNGHMPNLSAHQLDSLSKMETGRLVSKFIDERYVSERMRKSLQNIGKTITTWPQLGGTAFMNAGLISKAIRTIATGQPLKSGRFRFSREDLLDNIV